MEAYCNLRGTIHFPCGCDSAKVLVKNDAHGVVSTKCPICGKLSYFDYDAMVSLKIVTAEDYNLINQIKRIVRKGNNVEVKVQSSGNYVVYEVIKHIAK